MVTRGLDRRAAGAVFALTSLYFLVETMVRLGTDVGVVHFVAGDRVHDRRAVIDSIWASFIPIAPTMVVGAIAIGVLTPSVVDALGARQSLAHLTAVALALGIAVLVGATYDFMTAVTRGLGRSSPTVVIERVLRPVLQTVGVVAAIASGGGASLVVAAWILPYLVTGPIMAAWLRALLVADEIPLRSTAWRLRFREIWRFTLPRSATGILQILLQRLDIIIVGAILGSASAAVYTGATRFVVVGQLGNQAISYVFQPQLAGLLRRQRLDEARELYRVSTAWIVGLNAPLYLTVCVTAPLLVRLLGHNYHSGLGAMEVVTAASLVGSSCGLVDFVLITAGRTSWNLWNTTLALGINLAVDLTLIARFGIIAAAWGWAAAILINNLLPLVQVHRTLGFSPISGTWWRMVILSGLAFGLIPGLALAIAGATLPAMLTALAVALVCYLAVIWRWREHLALSQLLSVGRK